MPGQWERLEPAGKPIERFNPVEPPRHAILHLPDRDNPHLVNHPTIGQLFDELRLLVVVPHGGETWWSDRILPGFDPIVSAEAYLLQSLLPWLRAQISDARIGLHGVGVGGQGALRLAFRYPEQFPVVAALDAVIDFHEHYYQYEALQVMYPSKEACRQDTVTLHVRQDRAPRHVRFVADPTDADVLRGNDRLHEKLTALGIAHEFALVAATADDRRLEQTFRYLAEQLDRDRRRLL